MSDEDTNQINIKISDGKEEVLFKVKKTTKMGKVFKAYYAKRGIDPKLVIFHSPEGSRIDDADTPKTLELEDGDLIEATIHQEGGCCDCCTSASLCCCASSSSRQQRRR